MSKEFKFGLILGRFQTFHKGHEDIINRALDLCDNVGLFIGSSQESMTKNNPFSYEQRENAIRLVYGNSITIKPLVDIGVGNNCKWGEYVVSKAVERFGEKPDLFVTGKETRRTNWLDFDEGNSISELFVPKSIDISASQLRQMIIENDFNSWKRYVNSKLWVMFDDYRKTIIMSENNTNTKSI